MRPSDKPADRPATTTGTMHLGIVVAALGWGLLLGRLSFFAGALIYAVAVGWYMAQLWREQFPSGIPKSWRDVAYLVVS